MKLNNLIKQLESAYDDATIKTFDITTKEGYEGFKNAIDELKDSGSSLFESFGINMNEWLDNIEKIGTKIYEYNKEDKKSETNQIDRKVIDHSEETDDITNFKRPSELLSIQQKLQLHKIVEEYVNTMIRPYNNDVLTNEQINDAYAGLYEFAAWIMNR